jgi:osmotically inducible protein OsmC
MRRSSPPWVQRLDPESYFPGRTTGILICGGVIVAMMQRKASAVWEGNLKEGKGSFSVGSGSFSAAYDFRKRFEDAPGTNPEELLAAAHAACFSMALSAVLGVKFNATPRVIRTTATCSLGPKDGGGFKIYSMHLDVTGDVPGMTAEQFAEAANDAKNGCPVSGVFAGNIDITVDAVFTG